MESTPSGTRDPWASFIATHLKHELNPEVPIDDADNCRAVVEDKKTLRQCKKTIRQGAKEPFCHHHQTPFSRRRGIVYSHSPSPRATEPVRPASVGLQDSSGAGFDPSFSHATGPDAQVQFSQVQYAHAPSRAHDAKRSPGGSPMVVDSPQSRRMSFVPHDVGITVPMSSRPASVSFTNRQGSTSSRLLADTPREQLSVGLHQAIESIVRQELMLVLQKMTDMPLKADIARIERKLAGVSLPEDVERRDETKRRVEAARANVSCKGDEVASRREEAQRVMVQSQHELTTARNLVKDREEELAMATAQLTNARDGLRAIEDRRATAEADHDRLEEWSGFLTDTQDYLK